MTTRTPGPDAGRPSVAVVIPYYQRKAGLLARALRSVFGQRVAADVQAIVVDDSSPHPATAEVAGLDADDAARVTVIVQANAGPGAARNNGLDNLASSTDYVAFLDSDDEWLAGHLERAVTALESGHDIFFSDYRDIGRQTGGFAERGHLDPSEHEVLPGVPGIRRYCGDLKDAVLAGCPIETSTVVFRRDVLAEVRFRPEFRNSYEDYMFWLEMAFRSDRVAFSDVVGTQYGTGLNIYRGVDQDRDARFRVLVGSTRFGSRARRLFPLSPFQAAAVASRLERNRRAVALDLIHRLRRLKPFPGKDLIDFLRSDPAAWLRLPWLMVTASWCWLVGNPDDSGTDSDDMQ